MMGIAWYIRILDKLSISVSSDLCILSKNMLVVLNVDNSKPIIWPRTTTNAFPCMLLQNLTTIQFFMFNPVMIYTPSPLITTTPKAPEKNDFKTVNIEIKIINRSSIWGPSSFLEAIWELGTQAYWMNNTGTEPSNFEKWFSDNFQNFEWISNKFRMNLVLNCIFIALSPRVFKYWLRLDRFGWACRANVSWILEKVK